MPKLLSKEEISAYHRDGFLSPVRVMSTQEAEDLRQAYEAAEAASPQNFAGANRNNPHLILKCLDAVVHHPRILDAVEDILGPNILLYGSVFFIKEPNDPGFVSWHQDSTYMGLEPHDGVTAWLALSPSNPKSGCMRMLPQSHKGDIRPHKDTFGDDNILTRGQEIGGIDDTAAVDLVLEPGEISLHHLRVIHSSKPNRSQNRRIGIAIQCYLPPHVRQTQGPAFAQLVRGRDTYGHFQVAARPQQDLGSQEITLRNHVNALWKEILYQGAEKRRDY